ncbi:DUF1616 domain-containing protein [Halomarina pelagica]|uniref:DUF1616 domain-containing protein n=1 Tax=Halomarina pelagica TaxID=2961599 RepID=UPI0020C24E45|nr:DUF1616 domain-containing protein [Halomarina sp. BND7]
MSSPRGRSAGPVPLDLVVALVYLGVVDFLLVTGAIVGSGNPNPLRILLTLPVMLFLPGYALAAAAFPRRILRKRDRRSRARGSLLGRISGRSQAGIDNVERLGLAFGLSVALMPMLGLVVAADPGPMTATTAAVVITVLVAVLSLVAALRRLRVAPEERYGLPIGAWAAAVDDATAGSGLDTALSVALALSVLLAAGAFAVGLAAPKDGTHYTDFTVGAETEDGTLVHAGYPTDMAPGDSAELSFLVDNNENRTVEYTVVVEQQAIDANGEVTRSVELDRFSETVGPEESWQQRHVLTSQFGGERVQIAYLLYRGDVPGNPTRANADEVVYVEVQSPPPQTGSGGSGSNGSGGGSGGGPSGNGSAALLAPGIP